MENIKIVKPKGLNSFTIRMIAMGAMLCDHVWITLSPSSNWLHYVGRIAFPLFAFLLVEGFSHTSNKWQYVTRLFFFAALSELPFNLMHGGKLGYVEYQNVLWTFFIGLLAMITIEKIKMLAHNVVITGITTFLVGYLGMYFADSVYTDYAGYGVLTILLFYTCRNLRYEGMGELLGLIFINVVLLGGITLPFVVAGKTFAFPIQSLAILSLFFIRKYNGLLGPYNKSGQYFFYVFYPLHMLILGLLAINGVQIIL